MAKTKKTSGRGAPDDGDLQTNEEEATEGVTPTGATPGVASKWGGLIPALVFLGLIVMAIVLASVTD